MAGKKTGRMEGGKGEEWEGRKKGREKGTKDRRKEEWSE
jgi:hypothetical protein